MSLLERVACKGCRLTGLGLRGHDEFSGFRICSNSNTNNTKMIKVIKIVIRIIVVFLQPVLFRCMSQV